MPKGKSWLLSIHFQRRFATFTEGIQNDLVPPGGPGETVWCFCSPSMKRTVCSVIALIFEKNPGHLGTILYSFDNRFIYIYHTWCICAYIFIINSNSSRWINTNIPPVKHVCSTIPTSVHQQTIIHVCPSMAAPLRSNCAWIRCQNVDVNVPNQTMDDHDMTMIDTLQGSNISPSQPALLSRWFSLSPDGIC